MEIPPLSRPAPTPPPNPERDDPAWRAAQNLETMFLSEMLKPTLDSDQSGFGGGVGEDQFISFLREERARGLVEAGGIGLAERLYHALKETPDD